MNNTRQPQPHSVFLYTAAYNKLGTMEGTTAATKKLGPNNPDKAEQFVVELNTALDLFEQCIHSYNHYEVECAYPGIMDKYYDMLSAVEDYYSHASAQAVPGIISDKTCEIMCIETAKDREDQAKCPDPYASHDDILSGNQMINKLQYLPNFNSIKAADKTKIVDLFDTFQRVHNEAAKVVGDVAALGRTLDPKQFTFLLKHSLRPLVQIAVPPRLIDPTHLQFEHANLKEEVKLEETVINLILPLLNHLKLVEYEAKDATRCLVAAVHYVI